MQWTREGGFTRDGVEPWLPMGAAEKRSVAEQREDRGSMLNLCRDLIALRRERKDLHAGAYDALEGPEGVWAWRRGEGTVVAVNHGDASATLPIGRGEILVSTERSRDGERVDGAVRFDPWEAVVIAADD